MKQNIADPTFGLDGLVQALLSLLATREPTWAVFNEKAQLFEVSFRTGLYYESGLAPKVWIAMFPSLVARGPCALLAVDVNLQGLLRVETWGKIEDFPEREGPKLEWRTGEQTPFKELLAAVEFIESVFSVYYLGLRGPSITLVD